MFGVTFLSDARTLALGTSALGRPVGTLTDVLTDGGTLGGVVLEDAVVGGTE